MGPESKRKEARPRAASLEARSEAGSIAFEFFFFEEVEVELAEERKEEKRINSLSFSLPFSLLTHEYRGAVRRYASSFDGRWSLGTASSSEGSRPPPPPNEEEEEEIRSSPLAATVMTDRRRRGEAVDAALRLCRLLRLAVAAPTPTRDDGSDVDAPQHTRSEEEEDISRAFRF